MSEPVIRVGIVGAGSNTTRLHIPKLLEIDGVDIVAVCNRSRESGERVAAEWNIPDVYLDWRELATADGIDAVVIGTWPNMHAPVTIAALEAGKHVLCEARMARDVAEARAMRDAARERPQLVAQMVPSPLSFGVDAAIRRLLADGFLGRLVSIDVEARTGSFPDSDAQLHWREDMDLSGRNVMSLGIWYESVMRWVGTATAVTAVGKVTVPMRKDAAGRPRAVRIPDHLDVIAEMAGGAQARFQLSNATGMAPANRVTLFGHDGVLRFDGGRFHGARRGDEEMLPIEVPHDEEGTWRVEEDFIDAIRGRGVIELTDFDTGVEYMEFTEAVWLSMQRRCTVPLPLPSAAGGA